MDMPKNRISLFFMVLKDHVFDLIKVNLMQLIFWIPFLLWTYINLAAVQSIDTETVLSHADGAAELLSAISGYLMMWLIGLIPCIAITGPSSAGAALVLSATLIYIVMLPLLYPMMVGYELSFGNLIKNAFLMGAARLPQMLLARLITAVPVIALLMGIYAGNGIVLMIVSLYYLLFGFALSRLVSAPAKRGRRAA